MLIIGERACSIKLRLYLFVNSIDKITLFDRVRIYNEKAGVEREIQIVTTLRQNALLGYISKESPLGSALMGHAVGDRVLIEVSPTMSYYVKILAVEKGEDNTDLPISGY